MEFTVRVLGIREDEQWCAMALEMSLRGYGKTLEEAKRDLLDAIEAQVSFSIQHGTLESIWFPAEPLYVELYHEARRRAMRRYLESAGKASEHDEEYTALDMFLPQADREDFEAVVS